MATQTPSQRVAGNVRAELARRGISQAELAVKLNRSQPFVSRRILGKVPFNIEDLSDIARILDIPMALLVDGVAA
mgnify:CR=1 FL=1